MTFVSFVDVAMLAVILLCAGDAVWQVKPWREPGRALAFTLVTIGSFGWIAWDCHGGEVYWWSLALHAGFAIYAVILFRIRNPFGNHRHGQLPRQSSGRPV